MASRLALVLTWVVLLALLGGAMLLARHHAHALVLIPAAAMAGLIGWVFMDLRGAPGVVRLVGMGMLLWLSILFGALADWLTR